MACRSFPGVLSSAFFRPAGSSLKFSRNLATVTAAMGGGKLKMIAISGSLRKFSFNSGLIRAASEIVKGEDFHDVELEQVPIFDLPMLNTDLEKDGKFPETVEAFRAKVLGADAVLFASPENNYSVSAPLKNALDWASRNPNAWAGKPAAIISAGGGFGGGRSHYHLRQIGVFLDLHFINRPELFVQAFQAPPKFDSAGDLIDSDTRDRVRNVMLALRQWTLQVQK